MVWSTHGIFSKAYKLILLSAMPCIQRMELKSSLFAWWCILQGLCFRRMSKCRTNVQGRGLMFTWDEYCDLFQLFSNKVGADSEKLSSLKMVLAILTEGHIGALSTLIDRIMTDCPIDNYSEEAWQMQVIERQLLHDSLLDSLETNRGFPEYVFSHTINCQVTAQTQAKICSVMSIWHNAHLLQYWAQCQDYHGLMCHLKRQE